MMKINCRTILISIDSVNCSLLSPRRYSRLDSTNDPDSTLNHDWKGQYNLISRFYSHLHVDHQFLTQEESHTTKDVRPC